MQHGIAPAEVPATTFADLVWPVKRERGTTLARAVVLALLGSCLLTVSAKIGIPGPVPMTLQTLAVMALGAMLGMPLAFASVLLYIGEGLSGLAVFAGTPPAAPGLAYLMGPTGGFLAGFGLAAALVGFAADRGMIKRPLAFAAVLLAAEIAIVLPGFLWMAFLSRTGAGMSGLGAARAFQLGIQPFLLGDLIKLALAAVAFPAVFDALSRIVRR